MNADPAAERIDAHLDAVDAAADWTPEAGALDDGECRAAEYWIERSYQMRCAEMATFLAWVDRVIAAAQEPDGYGEWMTTPERVEQ